ncbi:sulfatase-like hydrolase/transferase [Granulicella sp. S190]|uniref:sulfatase-like hydrolase/transferase n=1 Tax=Granulicella sp. S190 TaxID=1747226 RepID=UPI00131DC4EE|nr:sulfatase-like hydrolase/transferase [Granulicella sp. S190]
MILIQLVWFGWQARSLNAINTLHRTPAAHALRPGTPRIIWILLDELSYQQVYGKRFPSLNLPEFDSLAAHSTVFTHVVPAGKLTEIVMPSLMSGLSIDKIRSHADGRLMIHRSSENRWENFDQHATVFRDALDAGYSTAVTGWYIPYCRILSDVLDRCSWTLSGLASNRSMPKASILRNSAQPVLTSFILMDLLHTALTHEPRAADLYATHHIDDYQELLASADRLLEDPSDNFILLHMPIPHPGGIYNRSTRSFTVGNSNYIDNLALADSYLAHVQSLLKSRGQWDSSTVVIMGDHSWRTYMWSDASDWTPEEQVASDGATFDDRPAYIVKAPYQETGARIDLPFNAVDTRLMLDAFLNEQITSAETLYTWVENLNKTRRK